MGNVMIRPFLVEDLSWVVAQEKAIFGATLGEVHYQALIRLGSLFGYVSETTERTGALLCSQNGEHVQIENLFVVPLARRQGVATLLLEQLIRDCETRSIQFISLEVSEHNVVAKQLYESLEFDVTKRIPNYYPDGSSALFMVYERRSQ
jgi:ribosomal protein S18 acetylase RimI-like enzyme